MFDDILAECIEALEQGATINDCLTRYPEHALALAPLLRLAAALSHESQTRLSSAAFGQGRQLLAAQARLRQTQRNRADAHHRHPRQTTRVPSRQPAFPPYATNGLAQAHRPGKGKAARWRSGMPRLLRTALLLLLVVGATTFARQVATSLPGTFLYPIKSGGEQIAGVLMSAAGEDIAWHGAQTERHLQALTGLTNPDGTTVQTLSQAVEREWAALLLASERLPATERATLLKAYIARFQALVATWPSDQGIAPTAAVTTVRKLITTGEAALAEPALVTQPTVMAATATVMATSTITPTATETPVPTITPTALLQPSATAVDLPILASSPTPTESPTLLPATSTPEVATPTVPPTPLPEITVQIPRQETSDKTSDNEADESNQDDEPTTAEAAQADATTAATTAVIPSPTLEGTPIESDPTLVTPAVGVGPEEGTPILTPLVTKAEPTPAVTEQTPSATVVEEVSPMPTKPTAATATPEPVDLATARPTNQPAATKTPKPTATQANAEPATPSVSLPNPTSVPMVAATAQPGPTKREEEGTPVTSASTPVAVPTQTPRPATPSGEATKTTQP